MKRIFFMHNYCIIDRMLYKKLFNLRLIVKKVLFENTRVKANRRRLKSSILF